MGQDRNGHRARLPDVAFNSPRFDEGGLLNGIARRWWVLLIGVTVLLATEYGMDVIWKLRYYGWGDFRAYYSAAWAVRQGEDLYDPAALNRAWAEAGGTRLKPDTHGYVYPPLFALLLQPVTLFSITTAARLWLAANAVLWVLGVLLLLRLMDLRKGDWLFWLVLFASLRFEPALWTLTAGQLNIVIFCLVIAGLYGLKHGCARCAGFHFALAGALKLTPLVLAGYLLLRRQYRPLLWTGVFSALFLAIGCVGVGIQPHLDFLTRILPSLGAGALNPYNQSLTGWALRLISALGWDTGTGAALWFARAGGVVVFGATIHRIRQRGHAGSAAFDLADVSLCILAVSIASPITWSHHLTWALLPLAVIFQRLSRTDTKATHWVLAMGAYVAVGVIDDYYVHPLFTRGPQVLLSSIKLYGLVAMFALIYRIRGPVEKLGGPAGGGARSPARPAGCHSEAGA